MANGKDNQAPTQVSAQSISRMSAGLLATAVILVVPLLVLVYLYLSELNRELRTLEKQLGSISVLQQLVALQIHLIDDYYGRYYPSTEAMRLITQADSEGPIDGASQDQGLWNLQIKAIDTVLDQYVELDNVEWVKLKNQLAPMWLPQDWSEQLHRLKAVEPLANQFARQLLVEANLVWSRSTPIRQHSRLLFLDIAGAKQSLLSNTEALAQLALNVGQGGAQIDIRQLQSALTQLEGVQLVNYSELEATFGVQAGQLNFDEIVTLAQGIIDKQQRLASTKSLANGSDLGLVLDVEKLRGLSWDKYNELNRAQLQLAGELDKMLKSQLAQEQQWRAIVIFWVALLILSAVLLGGYIVHNIRVTQLYLGAENQQLEARVKSRTEEIVAAKNEAEQLNRILGKQTQISTELARKAEMASSAKSLFLAAMSHEIRTPLNAVLGGAGILRKTALDDRQKSILTLITQSGKTLLELINEILDFSKIEANQLELEFHPFDLEEQLLDVVGMFSLKAKEKGIKLGLFFDSRCEGVWVGDALRIKQIVMNLLSNAVKFTEVGGISVRVSLSDDNHQLISVEDTGIGIKSEHLQNLFEAFVQSDSSTTRKYGGTGLGLSISKRIAEMHGGNISVVSTLGKGSTFVVALPLQRGDTPPVLEVAESVSICLLSQSLDLERQLRQWYGRLRVFDSVSAIEPYVNSLTRAQKENLVLVVESAAILKDQQHWQENLKQLQANKVRVAWVLLSSQDAIDCEQLPQLSTELKALGCNIQLPLLSTGQRIRKAILYAAEGREDLTLSWDEQLHASGTRLFSGRVLLAEDVEFNRIIAREILEACGLEVECVNDGDQAVKFMWRYYNQPEADSLPIRLILMDLHMPELNGLDATRQIRTLEANSRLAPMPIVAMTADVLVDTRQKIVDVGMDGYLPKPFEEDELINILARYCPQDQPATDAPASQSSPPARARTSESVVPASETVSSTPVFDHPALLRRVRGRADRIVELVHSYLEALPKALDDIGKLIHSSAYKELVFATHTLKGTSGNLGAVELQQCVNRMELLARQLETEQSDAAIVSLQAEWSQLCDCTERLTRAMQAYLATAAAS